MIIGIPKEIKPNEFRVSITPYGVYELVKSSHVILIESGAGKNSGFNDSDYLNAGGKIVKTIEEIYNSSEMIVKVKEPIKEEYNLLKNDQIIFSFLHLASNKKLTIALLNSDSICLAYETIKRNGHFPLLAPMSEIAGRTAAIVGSFYLASNFGGSGKLISGIAGIKYCSVLILGAGVAAKSAAKMFSGLGAEVKIMSPFIEELREIELENHFKNNVSTILMNSANIEDEIKNIDVLISAVYISGARTPIIIDREMIKKMKKGSVIVAIDIDQGSSIETAKPTTHDKPVYIKEGVVHYCVTNIPSIFPRTATIALTNLSLQYIKKIADNSINIIFEEKELFSGLNIYKGNIIYKKVAEDLNMMNRYKEF